MAELSDGNIPIDEPIPMETGEQEAYEGGHIHNVGMLDLTYAKTAEELSKIKLMTNVGVVLVPDHLSYVMTGIKTENVGMIVPVPTGENVSTITGQTKMTGEALASGDSDTILVIVGQVIISTPVTKVGYKSLLIVGQVCAPRGSESAFSTSIKQLTGQIIYYPEGARFFWGNNDITSDFLDFITNPTAFVVIGCMSLSSDISVELVKSKISEIILFGVLEVPNELLAIIQFLTTEKMGEIKVQE